MLATPFFFNDFLLRAIFRNRNFQHVKILFLTNVSEYRVLSSIDLKTVVPTCFEPQLSNKTTFMQKRIDRKNRRRFFQQQKKSEFRNAWVSLTFSNIFRTLFLPRKKKPDFFQNSIFPWCGGEVDSFFKEQAHFPPKPRATPL